jgi:hypothetical protein
MINSLLDAKPESCRVGRQENLEGNTEKEALQCLGSTDERDLGDIGRDKNSLEDSQMDMDEDFSMYSDSDSDQMQIDEMPDSLGKDHRIDTLETKT